MLPHPGFEASNVSGLSSRKRKLISDQGRNVSESCRFLRQSNLQNKVDLEINGQGSSFSPSMDSVTLSNRFEMDPQCHCLLEADNTGAPVSFSENSSDMMGIGHWNCAFYNNKPSEVWSLPSETLRPLELLHQSKVSLMATEPAGHLYRKTSFLEANCSNSGRTNDVSAVGVTFPGTSATAGKNESNRPVQDEVCCGADSSAVVILDNFREDAQFHGVGHVPIMKEAERAVVEKSGNSILPKNDPTSVNVIVDGGERNDKRESQVDKSIAYVGMPAPVVAEQLWDGSLQLNSTVTVSVVAFFKSGEKMPDLMWSEFLEVKGKVRLEAFEKYIQDLSRSCNRGLMVISLCCKEGSTKSELASLKEVAREYKKGKRIGLAQLSKGIDLYICPRSDTIITILGKHGFLKGMAAVEDNQHSWMGCVVWRRNKASSSSVIQESEEKDSSLTEQTLKSSSDSFAGIGKNKIGPKNTETSQVQSELRTSSSTSLLLTSSVLGNSSSKTNGLQTSSTDESACALPALGRLLQVEAPIMKNLKEKLKPTLEVHKHSATLASDITKETRPTPFDDDLPEFDFGTARGVSRIPASKLLDAVVVENQPPAEEFSKIHGSLPRKMPTMQSILAPNQGEFEDFNLPMFSVGTLSRMPLHKEVGGDRKKPLPKLEESQVVQRKMPFSTAAVPFSKKLFHDDDDMPEWSPPDMELHHKQAVSETTRQLTTAIFSEVLNSSFERLSPGRPGHLLSSWSPASYPPFTTQAFTSAFTQPMNRSGRPSQPRPSNEHIMRRPNPMLGFRSKRLLRPSLTPLNVKPQVRPTGLRSWNP